MKRFMQRLHDFIYYGSVLLGGTNFKDMEEGAEEWRVSARLAFGTLFI